MGKINSLKKVLAFAREAGGAACISPICQAMKKEGWRVLLLAKDYALDVFRRDHLECIEFSVFNEDTLQDTVKARLNSNPDIILTSATSLPTLDMTEKYLWRWARNNNILSVGVLDQWQNYALRFSGPTDKERLAFLPDLIFAMDELAKNEMIEEGIPSKIIKVTGQTALAAIKEKQQEITKRIDSIRKKAGIPQNHTVVTFVCESLKKDFGNSLDYDEQSVIKNAGDILANIAAKRNFSLCLVVKLHPENKFDEFSWVSSQWNNFKTIFTAREVTSLELIAISDLVLGMSSIMLMESIVFGKPTVSLQINNRRESQLAATKAKAIPFINNTAEAQRVLDLLLSDTAYRISYLRQQKEWKVAENAVDNCMEILKRGNTFEMKESNKATLKI